MYTQLLNGDSMWEMEMVDELHFPVSVLSKAHIEEPAFIPLLQHHFSGHSAVSVNASQFYVWAHIELMSTEHTNVQKLFRRKHYQAVCYRIGPWFHFGSQSVPKRSHNVKQTLGCICTTGFEEFRSTLESLLQHLNTRISATVSVLMSFFLQM